MQKQTFKDLLEQRAGLLCNHSAWNFGTGSYFFEETPYLQRIFIPEHGLFSELQDQVPITDTDIYKDFGIKTEVVSLYGDNESALTVSEENLLGLEVLFVDLQDVGSRYFTFAVTLGNVIKSVIEHAPNLPLALIDRENSSVVNN